MSQVIKIPFYQIVSEMWGYQKWQFDKIWFCKLLCDNLLNLCPAFANWAKNTWLWLPLYEGVPPIVHMKRQITHWPWNPPPHFRGGRGYHFNSLRLWGEWLKSLQSQTQPSFTCPWLLRWNKRTKNYSKQQRLQCIVFLLWRQKQRA